MNIADNKEKFISVLLSCKADTSKVLQYLNDSSFFEDPASTRYHGSFPGGLCAHSLNVYRVFLHHTYLIPDLTNDDIVLCSLLHDVCKTGSYIKSGSSYSFNRSHPFGHASQSLTILNPLVKLSLRQINMIKFHMGIYACFEFNSYWREYSLKELTHWYNWMPECKLFHMMDELATLEESRK